MRKGWCVDRLDQWVRRRGTSLYLAGERAPQSDSRRATVSHRPVPRPSLMGGANLDVVDVEEWWSRQPRHSTTPSRRPRTTVTGTRIGSVRSRCSAYAASRSASSRRPNRAKAVGGADEGRAEGDHLLDRVGLSAGDPRATTPPRLQPTSATAPSASACSITSRASRRDVPTHVAAVSPEAPAPCVVTEARDVPVLRGHQRLPAPRSRVRRSSGRGPRAHAARCGAHVGPWPAGRA